MTPAYVCRILDMLLYHPFKNDQSKSASEALTIMQSILEKATKRFEKSDTFGLFDNPVEYLICFNTFCVDLAREEHGLNEADYYFMIDEHNLSSEMNVSTFYAHVARALKAQLEGGDEGEED